MKNIKYQNVVLTVIAFFLGVITMSTVGFFPTASAREHINTGFATVPINKDGSITVKLAPSETVDVNIDEINGGGVLYHPLPVIIKNN